MARRNYSNIAIETTLASGIGAGDTSLIVASATGWPAAPFYLVIEPDTVNEELILVGGKSGTTFSSLSRGQGGTSASAHSGGTSQIKHVVLAEDLDKIWTHAHTVADDTPAVGHGNLSGVTANQHHNQVHALGGADHTGTIDHGSQVAGLGDDDHTQYLKEKASGGVAAEVPIHTHASAGEAGQFDHGNLTGQTDDDHTQYLKEKASGGTAAEVPEHAHNAGSQGGLINGAAGEIAMIQLSSSQGMTNDTDIQVAFNLEVYDFPGGMAADSQAFIEADLEGLYLVTAQVYWSACIDARHHRIWLAKDDGVSTVTIAKQSILTSFAATSFACQVTALIDLSVGDMVELWARHNSGAGITLEGGLDTGSVHPKTWMMAHLVS